MHTRANEHARAILAEHEVPELPEAAEKMIKEVLAERAVR
jgi:trimethylamine:corrinoid methyltransferase-like protein